MTSGTAPNSNVSTQPQPGLGVPEKPAVFDIYDTTLRDGAQMEAMRLTVADKLRIAGLLDDLGVNWIEGGWPGANPNDTAFFAAAAEGELILKHAELVAFGSTRKVGTTAADDPQVKALVDSLATTCCLVVKAHARHVTEALRTTLDENLHMIADTVSHLVGQGRRVFVDLEHFFDGYLLDRGYATEVITTAAEAGAEVAVLCDTNGGMLPHWVADIVAAQGRHDIRLGVHAHNDTGCAVANSMAAISAGASHVQGTINGYGERTGNADLGTVIANLQVKYQWPLLRSDDLAELTRISQAIGQITNIDVSPRQPYVGHSAFAHKAGLHASAIKIDPDLYQHIDPTKVGNDMRMLVSDMAGRASIQLKGSELGFDLSDPDTAAKVVARVKQREADGYSYESADASFALLLKTVLGTQPDWFTIEQWRAISTSLRDLEATNEANVKLVAHGQQHLVASEGNGPVNALDIALKDALSNAYPIVAGFELVDYKVRILDSSKGTDAVVRVLIDFTNDDQRWTTVGVGANIIEASWGALLDSYNYGLDLVLGDQAELASATVS